MLTVVTAQPKGKVSTQTGCWSRRSCFLETLASWSEILTPSLQAHSKSAPHRVQPGGQRNIGISDDLDPLANAYFVSQSCEPS